MNRRHSKLSFLLISLVFLVSIILSIVSVEARYFRVCKHWIGDSHTDCANYYEDTLKVWGAHEIEAIHCSGDGVWDVEAVGCLTVFSKTCPSAGQNTYDSGYHKFYCDTVENTDGKDGRADKDWLGSIRFVPKPVDETPQACAVTGKGQWTGVDCCTPGEGPYITAANQVCYNGVVTSCDVLGKVAGNKYICTIGSKWLDGGDNLAPERICAAAVYKDISRDPLNPIIYLMNAPTETNRCCGDTYFYLKEDFETFLLNPTFKQINSAAGVPLWTGSKWIVDSTVQAGGNFNISLDYVNYVSLNHSLKLSMKDATSTIKLTTDSLLTGSYALTAWVKAKNFQLLDPATSRSAIAVGTFGKSIPLTGTYDWKKVNVSFRLTAPTMVTVYLGAVTGKASGTIWFDDIKILPENEIEDEGYVTSDGNHMCTYDGTNWVWKFATEPILKFDVTTIKNKFDVISNMASWWICNATNVGGIPRSRTFNTTSVTLKYVFDAADTSTGGDITQVGSTSTTSTASSLSTGSSIALTQFTNGFSQVAILPTETAATYNDGAQTIQIAISPPIVQRTQQINLKMTGLPASSEIKTDAGFKIRVKDGDVWRETSHPAQVSSNGQIGFVTPFYITLPADIAVGTPMLNITIAQAGGSIKKYYSISFTINQPPMTTTSAAAAVNPLRFLCHKEQSIGIPFSTISECCGPNYLYCNNPDKNVSRISGGPTGLIKDFYGNNAQNNVFRFGFQEGNADSNSNHKKPIFDLTYRNWKLYNNLEFDVFIAGSKNLNVSIEGSNKIGISETLFNDKVLKYSVSGDDLNKWHHVVIPLTEVLKNARVDAIRFITKETELTRELGSYQIGASNTLECNTPGGCIRQKFISGATTQNYLLIVGIDRFYLSNSETTFCVSDYSPISLTSTNRKVGAWSTDLDMTGTGADEACNNVASFGWTGTKCCGDDQKEITDSETFNDDDAGCWSGMPVGNNSIVTARVNI